MMSNLAPKATPTSYGEAMAYLGTLKRKDLCYATHVVCNENRTAAWIEHHGSPIVEWTHAGRVTLDNHEYFTRTTKDRMQRFTGARIEGPCATRRNPRCEGPWVVHLPDGRTLDYHHGMTYWPLAKWETEAMAVTVGMDPDDEFEDL